jgi:hypothetical protein
MAKRVRLDEGQAELAERSADTLAMLHPDLEEQLLRFTGGLAYGHNPIILLNINT